MSRARIGGDKSYYLKRKEKETHEKELNNYRQMRYRCKYNLGHLCKNLLGHKDWDVVHDDIYEFLEEEGSYKLVLIPRGHLKSSMVTVGYTIQKILREPNIRILIAHAIWDYSRNFLKEVKIHLETSDLKLYFGDFNPKITSGSKRTWSKDSIEIAHRTKVLAAPTVATTGVERTQTSQHYDYIILDDVVSRENTKTPEQRKKVEDFFKDCLNLLEPTGKMVVIGTTWHEEDLYNTLLDDEDFKVFKKPARENEHDKTLPVLFPKKFNHEILDKLKRKQGPYLFSSQYLLNPYPEEEQRFKDNWFRQYNESKLPDELYIVSVLDPSLGKDSSDYQGLVTIGIDDSYNKYVLDATRLKVPVDLLPSSVVEKMRELENRGLHVNMLAYEGFAFQQLLNEPIRMALLRSGLGTGFDELPRSANIIKKQRIESLQAPYSRGEILHGKNCHDLEDELKRWHPVRKNKHDDLVDALSWTQIYWDNKPKKRAMSSYPVGSFLWHLNNLGKDDKQASLTDNKVRW